MDIVVGMKVDTQHLIQINPKRLYMKLLYDVVIDQHGKTVTIAM